ncbi:MAG: Trp family transcriptional regulator [Candidatus Pacebacteria bacterium]|jgi:uncharacterized protein YerC|nr:Trp family transcriptional regulator [Candidatus Paceibacterota bacterium]MDP6659395.1 Trp family transcriptional regulator [Candidatus Paceibacterota bacterium]|tara:strand:- start:32747 stop:33145 length:399 start_codon:yes stop_codon:yes gene_type:complete
MPHISTQQVEDKIYEQISDRFNQHILNLKENFRGRSFLGEIFTGTERTMFAKRLSILFMLSENVSYLYIQRTLKVSPSTIRRLHVKMDRGGFSTVLSFFKEKKQKEKFWKDIESLSRGGLPPMGRGRWKNLK